ncbi:MAG: type II toxin-antitoxin system HicA family toxin [Planctomycetota bacterium]|nr:type II toxin-antitoxin system HicA family toxin [Planctomycetota bacterium]
MTRLPRDVSGAALARALGKLGYAVIRQTGSHIRLTREGPSEHHITIPNHNPLKIGTLSAILRDVAARAGISREQLIETLSL